ncbi:MAG: pyruvate kinase [Alphaproteobacteria bacterium]|nr:pyruvate kinase [Alphaproteobacteria bacterium]
MRRFREAKIVATLGPASSDAKIIRALFEAGADVFRLNLSHGSHDEHQALYDTVRALEAEHDRPVGILCDLQGPKLRLGEFKGGKATLKTGDGFRLDLKGTLGSARRVALPHPEIFSSLGPGSEILIDDGRVRLSVVATHDDHIETKVKLGGPVSDHKGVNLPGTVLGLSPLTAKDRKDLTFSLDMGCDWVGLSFVQRAEDIAEARRLIGGRARIMAKLEKPSAIDYLDQIVEQADAVMVARGDLGVELPPEAVPGVQKQIVRACRNHGVPVVVATQMLESMVSAPTPTRAEASDVATAIYDGADAVMLSAESAVGDYPVEAVTMMNDIILQVEADEFYRDIIDSTHYPPDETAADAITAAAAQVAETINASAIVTYTNSGSTALRAARERPAVPILCLTPNRATARWLSVAWGIHAVVTADATNLDDMVSRAVSQAKADGFAEPGDRIAVTAGIPFGTPGNTNLLHIVWIEK